MASIKFSFFFFLQNPINKFTDQCKHWSRIYIYIMRIACNQWKYMDQNRKGVSQNIIKYMKESQYMYFTHKHNISINAIFV